MRALQVLGLLVSWSTFLMIGATSGLTFNVVGNLKLIIVLAGGVAFFGDVMPPKKLAGVCLALAGIGWYSFQVRCPAWALAAHLGLASTSWLCRSRPMVLTGMKSCVLGCRACRRRARLRPNPEKQKRRQRMLMRLRRWSVKQLQQRPSPWWAVI